MQVEEQKRRAEADKLAAITALEVRSREFMVEKEEKRRLEARITSMQSQLLIGGHKIEDMPVFRYTLLIMFLRSFFLNFGPHQREVFGCSHKGQRYQGGRCAT